MDVDSSNIVILNYYFINISLAKDIVHKLGMFFFHPLLPLAYATPKNTYGMKILYKNIKKLIYTYQNSY